MKPGTVYLIGAGPGDPGLITQKALQILALADCVVYDYLAGPGFLENLNCEKIYVGKKASEHTLPQNEINELLISKAKQGKTVARLKGGDPFIFGRGGEEAEALLAAGIAFSVVPGISSFYSAPAYAGIPLTHRDYADAFEVITGHRRDDASEDEDINFPDFNQKKTFVFLMGMKNLGYITEKLISIKKFPEDIPAAIVSWGTTPNQKVVTAALGSLNEKAEAAGISAPAIIIIGRVVLLRDTLRWFDKLPLFGKKIAVTRTREQASKLSEKLRGLGANVIEFPTIEIKVKSDLSVLRNAIQNIGEYQWIIFTSQNAVGIFFNELKTAGLDGRCFSAAKIAAIGPATSEELEKRFIIPDMMPAEYVAEELLSEFKKRDMSGKKILLPCASEARPVLKEGLARLGAIVNRIDIYDTVIPEEISEEALMQIKSADIITFTSSSTVRNFFKMNIEFNGRIACIGPVTADAVKALGRKPDITASEYTIDGLVEAILKYYK